MSRLGEAQRQRQPHVTASDDSYLELRAFEKFRFTIDCHEFVTLLVICDRLAVKMFYL